MNENRNSKPQNPKKEKHLIALAGNPNSGKTTIFNALTGARHHVGNYPGVTVERREGETSYEGRSFRLVDLPGTYSLSPHSPDERVARNVLVSERPDAVIQIVDAGNLERNLYLTVQLLEMKVPLVLAFNMMDEVEKRGVRINIEHLSRLLGVPIVPTVGHQGKGIRELLAAAAKVAEKGEKPKVEPRFGPDLDRAVEAIKETVKGSPLAKSHDPRWLAIKLLEDDPEIKEWFLANEGLVPIAKAEKERERVRSLLGDDAEILLADARYGWVHGAVSESVSLAVEDRRTLTDQVDRILANRVLGLPIFLFFMWLTFAATFKLGQPLADLVDAGMGVAAEFISGLLPPGLLRSLVVDGALAGAGAVLVFVPNIAILFALVSIMEDSGYMARAAFIVDKVMHLVGLHGKSFIPMFVGFGCNVPAIMGTRILENERDRITTILVCPFMSCSARLPVYVLLAGAFFPARVAGDVVFSLYLLGVVVAMVMARLLRTHVVKGPPTPFVMELPPYRMPTLKGVAIHVWERVRMYLRRAGTLILAVSILVWFFSNFPRKVEHSPELKKALAAAESPERLPPELKIRLEKERLEKSYAGRFGHVLAPLLKPAGLDDWKVGVALVAGFAAKEIVVSTMGTLYSVAAEEEAPPELREALREDPFFTPLRAYAMMVFVLLYVPCMATVVVAYRELGSWKWTLLMVGMTMSVAYLLATLVWQGGRLLGFA